MVVLFDYILGEVESGREDEDSSSKETLSTSLGTINDATWDAEQAGSILGQRYPILVNVSPLGHQSRLSVCLP